VGEDALRVWLQWVRTHQGLVQWVRMLRRRKTCQRLKMTPLDPAYLAHVCECAHVCVCVRAFACAFACICVCVHVCVYVWLCVCVYAYVNTCLVCSNQQQHRPPADVLEQGRRAMCKGQHAAGRMSKRFLLVGVWCLLLLEALEGCVGAGVGGRAVEGRRVDARDWAATAFISCEAVPRNGAVVVNTY